MHPVEVLCILVLALIGHQVSAFERLKTFVAPLLKDTNTSLYTITLNSREHYVIDLDSPFLWFPCVRPRREAVAYVNPLCTQAHLYIPSTCPPLPNITASNYLCVVTPINPVTKSCSLAQLTYNNLIIYWTNGRNPVVGMNFNNAYFSCAPPSLLQNLPSIARGVAGLSSAPLSLPSQITPPYMDLARKFAICLPSRSSARGVMYFGDGPIYLQPPKNIDPSANLSYTPLLKNVDPSRNLSYYIGLQGISVNGKGMNHTSLSLPLEGVNVKLSTTVPYTTLRSDIYKALVKMFSKATKKIPRANRVSPFELCLETGSIGTSCVGLRVPRIDLELASGNNWTIYGANSMKQVGSDVACLAFVDGGETGEQGVVIGSFQMENNFLLFDLEQSRLGFSSSLFLAGTSCGTFNFTTPPWP